MPNVIGEGTEAVEPLISRCNSLTTLLLLSKEASRECFSTSVNLVTTRRHLNPSEFYAITFFSDIASSKKASTRTLSSTFRPDLINAKPSSLDLLKDLSTFQVKECIVGLKWSLRLPKFSSCKDL